MSIRLYDMVHRKPILCKSWTDIVQAGKRGKWRIRSWRYKEFWVSTVFISVGITFDGCNEPLLFETMMKVNGEWSGIQLRARTHRQALRNHGHVKEMVKKGLYNV